MTRAPLLTLRLDVDTRSRWDVAAEDAGYTLSEFVRQAVEAQIEQPRTAAKRDPRPGEVRPRARSPYRRRVALDRRDVTPDPKPGGKK